MSQTQNPQAAPVNDCGASSPPAAENDCGCPPESTTSTSSQPSIISADVDAGTNGIAVTSDVLGSNFADASVGLGAVNGLVGTVLGLADGGGSGGSASHPDGMQAALISADIDAGTNGVTVASDVLGSDFVDASVGLGAVDGAVGTVFGLADTGTGLLDGIGTGGGLIDGVSLCDIV
jgi:hypothetical protein